MEGLLKFLNHIKKLSDGLTRFLEQNLQTKTYNKGDYLLKEGQVCTKGSFISRGIVYGAYTLDKNKDVPERPVTEYKICNKIYKTNDVIISVYSFFEQAPSYESLICLNDKTTIIYISYDDLQYCLETFPELNYIIRIFLQKYYVQAEVRRFYFLKRSAAERYQLFLSTYGEIAHILPSYVIASYIGINEATLSRIKKQVKSK